jgi:hypothetical protein
MYLLLRIIFGINYGMPDHAELDVSGCIVVALDTKLLQMLERDAAQPSPNNYSMRCCAQVLNVLLTVKTCKRYC